MFQIVVVIAKNANFSFCIIAIHVLMDIINSMDGIAQLAQLDVKNVHPRAYAHNARPFITWMVILA